MKKFILDIVNKIGNIIKFHKFFVRESQHYILGNWIEYMNPNDERVKNYKSGFLRAYIKFMLLSLDGLGEHYQSSYPYRPIKK